MSEQLAIRPKASQQLASFIGMEPSAMLDTIKAQCFKCQPSQVSDAQLAAFVSVASAMQVNPLLPGMLYAYPTSGGGIVPIMGPDGVYKKLMEHPEIDSWDTEVFPADVSLPPTHAITRIYRKGRERPISYTAVLSEWRISSNPNWNTRPRHFLALRSLKHAARQIIHGLPYDEDDCTIMGEINVTPGAESPAEPQVQRAAAPARAKKGASTVPDAKPAAIEAEIVPETKVEPKPVAKADPVEIAKAMTPYAEKEAPAPVPAPEPTPTNVPTARAFLKDGEAVQVKCTVKEITTLMVNFKGTPTPSVSLTLGGEYIGPALHIGGASGTPDKLTPNAPWAPGATVLVSLRGKANPASGGKVLVRVDDVKAVEASPANPAMDVE